MPLAEDLAAWLRLSLTPGLSSESLRRLLADFGGPEPVLAASRAALARHVGDSVAAAIKQAATDAALAAVAAWLEDSANHVVTLAGANDRAGALHVKGEIYHENVDMSSPNYTLCSAKALYFSKTKRSTRETVGLRHYSHFMHAHG